MISISLIGSILPLTWVILSSSKHLIIWATASTSLIFARNLFPKPSPLDAPSTRPAISTNVSLVGIVFDEELIIDNCLGLRSLR